MGSLPHFPHGTSGEMRFVVDRTISLGEMTDIVIHSGLPAGSIAPMSLDQEHFIYR